MRRRPCRPGLGDAPRPLSGSEATGRSHPRGRPDDLPRAADRVQRWANWCYEWPNVSCAALLFHMSQALDYLGADRTCVLNVYTDRVEYLSPRGSGADIDYARDSLRLASVLHGHRSVGEGLAR